MAQKPQPKNTRFQDLALRIEYDVGDRRYYHDDKYVVMKARYGEVRGTTGVDGDPVDVYVGPDEKSTKVFVVKQMKRPEFKTFDEEKCILGTRSAAEAEKLYKAHYNDARFFGGIKELTMDEFKERLATRGQVGQKIAAAARRIAELNYMQMQAGAPVLAGTHGIKVALDPLAPLKKREVLGEKPEVDELPATTSDFNAATKESMDYEKRLGDLAQRLYPDEDRAAARQRFEAALAKVAAAGREQRIADRIDEAGLGLMAAPHVADGVSKLLKNRGGRLGAVGRAAGAAADALHRHDNKVHTVGLALVAPSVSHGLARRVDKLLPGEKTAAVPPKAPGVFRRGTELLTGSRLKTLEKALKAPQNVLDRAALAAEAYTERGRVSDTRAGAAALGGTGAMLASHVAQRRRKKQQAQLGAPAADRDKEKKAELEKLASQLNPDFEYLTEPEKLAYLGALKSLAAPVVSRVAQGARSLAQKAAPVLQGAQSTLQGAPQAAGQALSPLKQRLVSAGQRLQRAGTVAKGLAAGGAVAGSYGLYKGTKALANFVGHEHTEPVAPPSYQQPRLF